MRLVESRIFLRPLSVAQSRSRVRTESRNRAAASFAVKIRFAVSTSLSVVLRHVVQRMAGLWRQSKGRCS
jgi:hypothetical protein